MHPMAVPHYHHSRTSHSRSYHGHTHVQTCHPSKPQYQNASPHPYVRGTHRRRFLTPISPLSQTSTSTMNSYHRSTEDVLVACDREVQWSFEQEYGAMIEQYMLDSEVFFQHTFAYCRNTPNRGPI
jgi:hypothetical protein